MQTQEVRRILDLSRNLQTLRIRDRNMLIDSKSMIESILDLTRGRIQVEIMAKSSNICMSLEPNHRLILSNNVYGWLTIQLY